MDFLFQFTRPFEKDLRKLSTENQELVHQSIQRFATAYTKDRASIHRIGFQPHKVRLVGGYDSTLYAVRVGRRLRILLTIDEDPIFDQLIVKLLRVASHGDLGKVYRSVAESLYQSQLAEISDAEAEAHGPD